MPTPPAPRRSWRARAAEALIALAACGLAAAVFATPLSLQPDARLATGKFYGSHLWAMEMVRLALRGDPAATIVLGPDDTPPPPAERDRPPRGLRVYTTLLEHPRGGPIVLLGWTNLLAGAALRTVLPPLAAFNVVLLLTLALAPWCAYLLARGLGAGRGGAALAALIYGFSPYIVGIVANGQLAKLDHGWIALLALAVWRVAHERRLRWLPLAWLAGLLCLASSPYYTVAAAALGALLAAWGLARQPGWAARAWSAAGSLAIGGGVALLGTPLLHHYAGRGQSLFSPASMGGAGAAQEMAATPLRLVAPLACRLPDGQGVDGEVHVAYLGLAALALALAGTAWVWARRRDVAGVGALAGWWAVAAVFATLAMGRALVLPGGGSLPLPLGWLAGLHDVGAALVFPYRFVVVATLALAMVVALGAGPLGGALARRLAARLGGTERRWAAALGIAAGALIAADALWVGPAPLPIRSERFALPQVYAELAADPDRYGIVEFPCELGKMPALGADWNDRVHWLTQRQLLYQGFHHKGLGMVDKGNANRPLFRQPLLRDLALLLQGAAPRHVATDHAASLAWLRQRDYRLLLLHEDHVPAAHRAALRAYLDEALGEPRVYAGDGILRYSLTSAARARAPAAGGEPR